MKTHPLVDTLLHLKGNPKACVYTEPLWGIPYNLFIPFASIYMVALGLSDSQIGLIASMGMAFQIVFALLSGVITDKMGRKRATFIFDFIAWSIPCLIWAFSSSFIYFVAAAVLNSVMRITVNSWGCLLVEDSDRDQIVNIYAWIYIAGLLAAFFAPVTGLFIGRFELVPTIRVIYLISFVLMTAKFIILNIFATETRQGKIRMEETRHHSMLQLLSGYGTVIRQLLRTPETMLTLGIMLVMGICTMVNSTFWSIIVTQELGVPDKTVGLFPLLRSFIMLLFFIILVPGLKAVRFRNPLITGFLAFIASQLLFIFTPERGWIVLIISIFLEACALSLVNPLLDSMEVILVDQQERARVIAMMYVSVMALSSPFGWIAGLLSEADKRLPFIMNIVLLAIGILLTILAAGASRKTAAVAAEE